MCERIWADSSGRVLKFQAAWTKRLLSRMVRVQRLVSKYSNPWVVPELCPTFNHCCKALPDRGELHKFKIKFLSHQPLW